MANPFPYVFCGYWRRHFLWFRLFNRVLVTVKGSEIAPLFTERYMHTRPVFRFLGWRVFIKRDRMP